MITPLLSTPIAATGFGSCWKGAAVEAAWPMTDPQPEAGQS